MNLTQSQINALLKLGESAGGHDFITQATLDQLLKLDLVYWRKPDEIDFTPAGEQVYNELSGLAIRT